MRETARVLSKLLASGELSTADTELFADYRKPEVRADLDILGEEMGFMLIEMRSKVYLVPRSDSDLLALSIREIRERESRSDRMIDVFLQCYIIMTILWMCYGGKNINPKRVTFLQTKDIVDMLDERFRNAIATQEASDLENSYEINFPQIAEHWGAMQVDDPHNPNRRKTKKGVIMSTCRLLESQKLLIILDEGREIRPTNRLDDLMIGYYLDTRRIGEIHELFDRIGDIGNAEAEQD
jgi:hypothetical protein